MARDKPNIREFRHSVSVLKKQGLISVDARKATPNQKVKGKKLSTLLKKYDDIVSGKATAVKVSSSQLKAFRKTGFETTQDRVIVPHSKGEIAKIKRGQIAIHSPSGMERVQIPVEFHNLNQYLRDIRNNAAVIDAMKRNNEYFGIRFYGGQRANFYSNINLLLDDLERYEDIQKYTGSTKQAEIYKNLEVLRISNQGMLNLEEQLRHKKKTTSKIAARNQRRRYRARAKRKGKIKDYGNANRQYDYRQRIKNNPRRYQKQLAKDRARWKSNHPKKKKPKKAKRKK